MPAPWEKYQGESGPWAKYPKPPESPGLMSKLAGKAWDLVSKPIPTLPGHPEPIEPLNAAQVMAPMVMGSRGMMNSAAGPVSAGTFSNLASAGTVSAPVLEALQAAPGKIGEGLMGAAKWVKDNPMASYLAAKAGKAGIEGIKGLLK